MVLFFSFYPDALIIVCYPIGLSYPHFFFFVFAVLCYFRHGSRIARTHYTRKLHSLHFLHLSRSVPVKDAELTDVEMGIAYAQGGAALLPHDHVPFEDVKRENIYIIIERRTLSSGGEIELAGDVAR